MNRKIQDFLPQDEELLRREQLFLDLFKKYSIDEGTDPKGIDFDSDNSSVSDSSSEISFSDNESEDTYDVEEMHRQLLPHVNERIIAWPEKGIHFQLKTVDPSVSVEDWLSTNSHEVTTKAGKYAKVAKKSKKIKKPRVLKSGNRVPSARRGKRVHSTGEERNADLDDVEPSK